MKELDYNDLNLDSVGSSFCYKNYNLYLSDYYNKTIHILNRELELIKLIPFDYKPYKIQISNETICILSAGDIYFYSIEDFKLKNKYENEFIVSYIANINSFFYYTGNSKSSMLCFNSNGDLVEKIDLKQNYNEIDEKKKLLILIYNNNLILSSSKKLIKFD